MTEVDPRVADLFSLTGEVAVVTGASSGIGQAAAEIIARAGGAVALIGRDSERLEAVADGIRSHGGTALPIVADVADRASIDEAFARVTEQLGAPSILVANAGISAGVSYSSPEGTLAAYPDDVWDEVVATNLNGLFATLRAGARVMRDGGRMLVTSSTAGLRADPMVGYAYVATKAAVLNVVRQAALEMAPRGIRVNAIAPGPFRTRIGGDRPLSPERAAIWEATIPLGRMGDTSEIEGPVLFLVSPASGFVTGATLAVDGGALALSHARF